MYCHYTVGNKGLKLFVLILDVPENAGTVSPELRLGYWQG